MENSFKKEHIVPLLLSIFHSQKITSCFAYKVEIYYEFKMLQDKYYEAEKATSYLMSWLSLKTTLSGNSQLITCFFASGQNTPSQKK